jgi:hypothetical protein
MPSKIEAASELTGMRLMNLFRLMRCYESLILGQIQTENM